MAPRTLETGVPSELAAALPPVGVVLAITDGGRDERYAPVRDAAARLASRSSGRVILFHAPPGPWDLGGRSRLFVPPPALDPAMPARSHTGSRMRDLFLLEASGIRRAGAEVAVWLARSTGPGAIAEAVTATGAGLVLVPADTPRGRPARRCVDRTLAYYAARIPVPLVSVDQGGRIERVEPLATGLVATARQLLGTGSMVGRPAGIGAGVRR